jgi:hypothetical protein
MTLIILAAFKQIRVKLEKVLLQKHSLLSSSHYLAIKLHIYASTSLGVHLGFSMR